MSAAPLDITIEAGATFNLGLLWADEAEVPIDNTGYYARMQVRRSKGDADTVLSVATSQAGILIGPGMSIGPEPGEYEGIFLGGANGEVNIVIGPDLTTALPAGLFTYDLELYNADPMNIVRLIAGTCEVSAEVTRV